MSSSVESPSTLCLVAGCDEGYALPLAVTLFSALKQLGPEADVTLYVIDGGILEESKRRLARAVAAGRAGVTIIWIKPTAHDMEGLEAARHLSAAAYLRLFIPRLLPDEIKRVLYLDCDILVRGDLIELWNTKMVGASTAAVIDYAIPQIEHPFSGVKDFRDLGISPDSPYFNSGVLLMDMTQWRQDNIAAKALKYALKHGADLGNCDQDALNATVSNDWLPLDYCWNVQYALFFLHDLPENDFTRELATIRPRLLREAKIMHFSGTSKPWNHWCGHPSTEEWVKALLSSGWFTPMEAFRWASRYWAKRILFKLKVLFQLHPLRERVT